MLEPFLHGFAVQLLHHLVAVGFVGVNDGIVDRIRVVAEHGLGGCVVGDFAHDALVLADLISGGVGVVDEIGVRQTLRIKELI